MSAAEASPLDLRDVAAKPANLSAAPADAGAIDLRDAEAQARPAKRYPASAPDPEPAADEEPAAPMETNQIEIVDAPAGSVHRNLYARIDTLRPHPENYNEHPADQVARLQLSLRTFGQTRSIVAWRGYILAGEGLWLAAKAEGYDRLRIDQIDPELSELEAQSYIAADNELARQSQADEVQLYALVMEARQKSAELALAIGFDEDDIAQLARRMQQKAAPQDTEDVTPQFERARELALQYETEPGQVWQLGRHRLAIGDCRDEELLERLTEGRPVDSMITDPPYGVDYADKTKHLASTGRGEVWKEIEGDQAADIPDYRIFFGEFLKVAPMAHHNTAYISINGLMLHNLRLALEDAGYKWSDYLVWVKNGPVIGRKDYNAQHEFVVYGWKGRHRFYGGYPSTVIDDQINLDDMSKAEAIETLRAIYDSTNVIRIPRPRRHERHPTEKPVALIERLIFDGSAPDATVYDPFLGSGTIYIAAERRKRRAVGVELRPEYAAVAIHRYKESTGIEPALVVD